MDYALGLSNIITKHTMAYWTGLFYHAHRNRIGHIPIVYQDAHWFHHHLHDTTSWDAHIFGSGAPEEWLILLADIFLALCLGMPPASLNPSVLAVSWYNKWGFHTRKANPVDDGENFHATIIRCIQKTMQLLIHTIYLWELQQMGKLFRRAMRYTERRVRMARLHCK